MTSKPLLQFERMAQYILLLLAILIPAATSLPWPTASSHNTYHQSFPRAFGMDSSDNFTIEGVGADIADECKPIWDAVLDDTGEFDKAGSAGAAMVMALLPSLLAFGPLKIANLRTFLHLGTAATLVTAVFTFGLPVEKLNTLKEKNVKSAKEFMGGQYDIILEMVARIDFKRQIKGEAENETPPSAHRSSITKGPQEDEIGGISSGPSTRLESQLSRAGERLDRVIKDLSYLQSLFYDDPGSATMTPLIQKLHSLAIREDRPSRLRIYAITALFIILQTAFGFTVAFFIPQIDKIYFIWACPRKGYRIFVYWFGVTLVMVSLAQVLLESPFLHADEVLHLSEKQHRVRVVKCPRLAAVAPVEYDATKGDHIQPQVSGVPGFAYLQHHGRFPTAQNIAPRTWAELKAREELIGETTWTHEILRRFRAACSVLKALAVYRKKVQPPHTPGRLSFISKTPGVSTELHEVNPGEEKGGLSVFRILYHILSFTLYRLISPHPMVVILRPSADFVVPRNPLITFFIGYMQLIWLGLVSILFGSTAGGTLVYTLAFVAAFVTTVAVARAFGIYMCYWLEKALDVQVLEYDNIEEQRALKMLICSAGAQRKPQSAEDPITAHQEHSTSPDRLKWVWVESQTGFYRYSKGFRLTPVPCTALYGSEDPQDLEPCKHVESPKKPDAHTSLTRESVGGWGFEVLCVLVAVVFAAVFASFMGVGLGSAWGGSVRVKTYGFIVGAVAFGITAALSGFTVWEETHATEDYKVYRRRDRQKKKKCSEKA